jgi:thiosulfate/3-mercaptopyruvate sulfurtransferase
MSSVRLPFLFLITMVLALCAMPLSLLARDVQPVVSTDWVEKNMNNPKVRIVDIRKVEEYREGHVPGAVSVFYGTWAIKKGDLDNEIPEDDDLIDIIGSAAISQDTWVVVAGKTDTPTDQVNQTRVAWTLKYAGLDNVAVLDGGYNKWVADKKPASTDQVKVKAVEFKPKWNRQILAKKEYVLSMIGKASIVDARMPDFYFGVSKLDFVARAGHIKDAVDLPSAWIFAKDGTFKSKEDLVAMAVGVVGPDKARQTIVYCDTGRLASGWWWVFSEVLEYRDVKSYDGSSQDWAKDQTVPMAVYQWR